MGVFLPQAFLLLVQGIHGAAKAARAAIGGKKRYGVLNRTAGPT